MILDFFHFGKILPKTHSVSTDADIQIHERQYAAEKWLVDSLKLASVAPLNSL